MRSARPAWTAWSITPVSFVGGPVEYVPLSEWRTQFEVNVFGQITVTQAALPLLRRARGRVVFVGSISGRVSTPRGGPYGASMHAIEAIGQSLREELRPWRIRVSVVAPGVVRTPIWGKGLVSADETIAAMPPEGTRLYGASIDRLRAQVKEIEAKASTTPESVSEVIEHALLSRRPKHHYLPGGDAKLVAAAVWLLPCLLYTSDAADERSSVDLGGRRIIKKKNKRRRYG